MIIISKKKYNYIGWRTNMEDAHIMEGNLDEDTAIFGVFDGKFNKNQLYNKFYFKIKILYYYKKEFLIY